MEAPLDMTLTSNNQAQTSLQTPLSAVAQSPNLFSNAKGFHIGGGQFVLGDVHNHPTQLGPPSVPLPLNSMDETFSESEIYCNQLLRRKRGFPLYVPEPRQNLPAEYREHGVAIGDVGRVTPEGVFDFFFNIYLPAGHPINDNDVPENFDPLPPYVSKEVFDLDYAPGNYVSTSSVQKLDLHPPLRSGLVFSCGAPQGAVLVLPHGAHLKKLDNLETVRAYAAKHAENWYKYVNGARGRRLANGSLYVSWGMASFHSAGDEFQLAFQPMPNALQYRWSGISTGRNPAQTKSWGPSPRNGPLDQTTFIHGLTISLGTGVWGRLFGTVEICDIEFRPPIPRFSFLGWFLGFFEGVSATGENQHPEKNDPVVLSDLSPISKIFRPGELINNHILHKTPQAAVVMSHDDDWRDILDDDPSTGSKIHSISEFLQRVEDQLTITERDGATFLVSTLSSSRNEFNHTISPLPTATLTGNPDVEAAQSRSPIHGNKSSFSGGLSPVPPVNPLPATYGSPVQSSQIAPDFPRRLTADATEMGTTTRYADIAVDVVVASVASVASAASAASVASLWAAMVSR
ncbi:hypothetical protein B0H13DRAFT_2114799 [Mycena leptocephala]|nr:hypothetical protein B0H13DRAFT_2114799 [Mycena leptocephala]